MTSKQKAKLTATPEQEPELGWGLQKQSLILRKIKGVQQRDRHSVIAKALEIKGVHKDRKERRDWCWTPQMSEVPHLKCEKGRRVSEEGPGVLCGCVLSWKGPQPSTGLHLELGPVSHIHIYSKSIHLLPSPHFPGLSHFSGT